MTGLYAMGLALWATSGTSAADSGGWRLVGAYDAAAVLAAVEAEADPEAEAEVTALPAFNWSPQPELDAYCGHPRAPTGMGVMESVAISTGLTPTLALVLRSTGRNPGPLEEGDVAVSLVRTPESSDPAEQTTLRPAVEPRRLSIEIVDQTRAGSASGASRRDQTNWRQIVRTQLGIQLCLEHMLGRAWSGGDENRVRQAFLLERPDPSADPDRRYLVAQRDPVAAYLGPPDACENGGTKQPRESDEASAELVPADVWEGRLRPCPNQSVATLPRSPSLPIRLSGADYQERHTDDTWSEMKVVLRDGVSEVPTVEVLLGEESLGEPTLLMSQASDDDRRGSAAGRMEDLLGRVPLVYPLIRQGGHWYTILLIPEWQLAEALARRDAMSHKPEHTMAQPAPGRLAVERDAVNWVLRHPELMRIQVRPTEPSVDVSMWPDLAVSMQGGTLGVRDWGYTVGAASGRASIALPTQDKVEWRHAELAQRAENQSAFTLAAAAIFMAFVMGLRRFAEFWRPIPRERADYWPAIGKQQVEDETPDGPSGMVTTEGLE
jgi:hypothetical protein